MIKGRSGDPGSPLNAIQIIQGGKALLNTAKIRPGSREEHTLRAKGMRTAKSRHLTRGINKLMNNNGPLGF
jgi:hypothetical protein